MLSSVILAERLEVLPSPYPVDEQSSHPYALGWTQIVPARDSLFTDADELGLVFQVLNPVPDARGKPDVAVEYSFLLTNGRADPLTARQDFSSRTLPDEFDLQKGHQVFAAQAVPLKTFAPGHYRVALAVTDNVARRTVTRELAVTVRATPQSLWLLKTVDGLIAPPFRRSQVLSAGAVTEALDELADLQTLTPAQSKAAADAREGRYAAVLGAMPAPADLASSFLRGLALMALNDNLEAAAGQFREALRFSSEFMPATVYLGACLAANGRDREAMAAWQLASAADTPTPLATELLADALMRTGNHESALDLLTEASTRWKDAPGIARRIAAVQVKAGRREEALVALDTVIEADAGDLDSLFLAIYLLAGGQPPASLTAAEREKLARYARTYVEATGPYRAIVEQWIADRERGN
jgi:tetratricopeptide (TPR) repeat protein